MSVVPLRLTEDPRASNKPRDVRGTVNIPYGYRLSQPGQIRNRINLTREKQTHSPEGITSLRPIHPAKEPKGSAKGSSKEDKGKLTSAKSPLKEEKGKLTSAKSPLKEEKGKLTSAKISLKEEKGKLVNVKDSLKEEKGKLSTAKDSLKEEKVKLATAKDSSKDGNEVTIIPGNPDASNIERKEKETRDYSRFMRTYEFVERSDKKVRKKKIINLVDEGIAEYDKSIEARRNKLRAMILTEEKSLIREVVDQAQRGADARIIDIRNRTEELRKRTEEERQASVTEKRMRQYLAQCPQARDRFAKKSIIETKYSNLVQIAEKEAKRQAEKELDVLWYELMLKEVEAMKEREVEEEKRRAVAGKSTIATLEEQIAGKLALSEEEKRVKNEEREYLMRIWETVRREKMSDIDREKEKRARLKRDLEEQLLKAKRTLVERARNEEATERTFRILSEAELSREKAATREATSHFRNEIVAYMRSLEEVRAEEARRNVEIEAVIEASAKKVTAQRDEMKQKSREARELKLREVLEGREQQLRLKRANAEEESKRAAQEDELRRKAAETEAALEAETEMRKREMALVYGQELKAQQRAKEEMRRCELEKNERMHREDLERDKEYEKLTEQLMNAPEIITPHAFKVLLKECAARRQAEQKGLCYCPRSYHQQTEQPTPSTGYL